MLKSFWLISEPFLESTRNCILVFDLQVNLVRPNFLWIELGHQSACRDNSILIGGSFGFFVQNETRNTNSSWRKRLANCKSDVFEGRLFFGAVKMHQWHSFLPSFQFRSQSHFCYIHLKSFEPAGPSMYVELPARTKRRIVIILCFHFNVYFYGCVLQFTDSTI
jgi:hypothetical protein